MIALTIASAKAMLGRNGLLIGLIAGLVVAGLTWDHNRIRRAEERGKADVLVAVRQDDAKINAQEMNNVDKALAALADLPAVDPDIIARRRLCAVDPACRKDQDSDGEAVVPAAP